MTERRITLDTVKNIRDLGSLETNDGHHIKMNHLLRSSQLGSAALEDLFILNREHRLKQIIDLRTYSEVRENPDNTIESISVSHLPVIKSFREGISHEKETDKKAESGSNINMAELYKRIIVEEDTRKNLREVMMAIFTHDYDAGSVLWHCTEGKDRCGIVSMLTLLALGVDYSTVLEDYLITNETNGPKSDAYYQYLVHRGEDPEKAKIVYDLFMAKDTYLNNAYEPISEYDDIYEFFSQKLCISRETIDSFRSRILE